MLSLESPNERWSWGCVPPAPGLQLVSRHFSMSTRVISLRLSHWVGINWRPDTLEEGKEIKVPLAVVARPPKRRRLSASGSSDPEIDNTRRKTVATMLECRQALVRKERDIALKFARAIRISSSTNGITTRSILHIFPFWWWWRRGRDISRRLARTRVSYRLGVCFSFMSNLPRAVVEPI